MVLKFKLSFMMKRKKCSLNLPHILDLSYQPYTGKKIADIENQSFASRNRTSAGRSLKSFHDISSKNAISSNSIKFLC